MARLSSETIARAAIQIADSEGLAAVSMRRVAAHLEVGTMSLYHHVPNKHALYSLMADAIMAEQLIPEGDVPQEWRAGLSEIARRAHALFTSHPWVLASWNHSERGDPGPSFVSHIEQTLTVVAGLDFLTVRERLQITGLVDEYVVGQAMRSGNVADTGDARDEWQAYAIEQAATGRYPNLAAALADGVEMDDHGTDGFEFGLERLLDGIEAYVEARRP